jgi:hypothetical protein
MFTPELPPNEPTWVHTEELIKLHEEIERLKEALQHIQDCGHNDDCLFCAMKDTIAKKVKGKE